jgi:hypothetical protein
MKGGKEESEMKEERKDAPETKETEVQSLQRLLKQPVIRKDDFYGQWAFQKKSDKN